MKKTAALILVGIMLALGFGQQFFTKEDPATTYGNSVASCESGRQMESTAELDPTCNCFSGPGSNTGDKPNFVWDNGINSLVVCGFLDYRANQNDAVMTEFSIFDGESGELVFWSDSLKYYRLIRHNDGILLCRVEYLPRDIGEPWQELEFSRELIGFVDGKVARTKPMVNIASIAVSNKFIETFRDKVRAVVVDEAEYLNTQEFMREALVCSISGDEFARDFLLHFESRLDIELSGSDAQSYADCIGLLELADQQRKERKS